MRQAASPNRKPLFVVQTEQAESKSSQALAEHQQRGQQGRKPRAQHDNAVSLSLCESGIGKSGIQVLLPGKQKWKQSLKKRTTEGQIQRPYKSSKQKLGGEGAED